MLLTAAALAADSAAAAAESTQSDFERACAAHPEPYPPGTDLVAADRRMRPLQELADPGTLQIACRAWRRVEADHAANSTANTSADTLRLDWRANVAASLFWLGRSADALALAESLFAGLRALGPANDARAGQVAALLAAMGMQRGEPAVALHWSQQAVDLLAQPSADIFDSDRLRTRINHGVILSTMRRFDEARKLLLQMLQQAQAQPDTLAVEVGTTLGALAMVARRQLLLDEALGYNEREIAWRLAHPTVDEVNTVNAMQNRGTLLVALARYDEAEEALAAALERARGLTAKPHGPDLYGHLSSLRETLSGLLLARCKPTQALRVAEEAVALLAERPDARSARGARPLRRLADAQLAVGDLAAGVATQRRALALLALAGATPDADTANALWLSHAQAMIELGDLDEAQTVLDRAAADPRPASPEERGRRLALAATLAQRRGDAAGAQASWQAAEAALAERLPPAHPQRRVIAAQRCESPRVACSDAPSPEALAEDATLPPEPRAMVALSLARRARAAGELAAAHALARSALAAAAAAGQPRLEWQALALLAELHADGGERERAILFGKLAVAGLQRQRDTLAPLGSAADARYLADKAPLYREVAQWLLDAGRLAEALELMHLLKRHEQSQFLETSPARGTAAPDGNDPGPSLAAAELAARARLAELLRFEAAETEELLLLRRRDATQRITADERNRLAELEAARTRTLGERLQRLESALAGLGAAAPAVGSAARPSGAREALRPGLRARSGAATVPGLVRAPRGELHAWLLAGEQRLSLLLVGSAGNQVHDLPLGAAALAERIATLRERLADATDEPPAQARELYTHIGRPIDAAARRQRARRIVVWLDGPLRYLPLGLLHDGRASLAQRYVWLVAGADRTTAAGARVAAAKAGPRVEAFGVTRALHGLPALPAVADELCGIVDGQVLGLDGDEARACGGAERGHGPLAGRARLNAHFTEAAFAAAGEAAGPVTLLHVGTHFVLRPGQVSRSWLLLGDSGRLSLDRLHSLPWGTPGLVTLSACETGVPGHAAPGGGREVDGLAAVLLGRGARQVLASLWRVDDTATAWFMRRFYAELAQRGARGQVLSFASSRSTTSRAVTMAMP